MEKREEREQPERKYNVYQMYNKFKDKVYIYEAYYLTHQANLLWMKKKSEKNGRFI